MLATVRLLGQRFLTVVSTVWQTLTAGRACQEPTTLTGNPYFVGTTPLPPASTVQQQSKEHVQQTTAEAKLGNVSLIAQALADNPSILAGFRLQTLAPQTHQPAKQESKPAKKTASKTKPAAKRTPAKVPAKTRTARRSGASGK